MWGVAIRNHEGDVLRVAHGFSLYCSIDGIELDAIEQGLLITQRYGFRNILVNTDSTTLVYYLKTES